MPAEDTGDDAVDNVGDDSVKGQAVVQVMMVQVM